jgi:flagellar biosynthetic protein FliP
MENKGYTNSAELYEAATPTSMGTAAEHLGTASPETGGRVRRYLGSWLRFTRHLLEMVVAMIAGMAVLGVAIGLLGEPPGYSDLLFRYGLMGAFMSAPMVAWMRHRGHPWSDGLEMTAAMLVPMFALVFPVELGVARYVPGLTQGSLPLLSHVAMIGGMAALMLYRFDRYVHDSHGRHA